MAPLLCTLLSTLLWQQTLEEEITTTRGFYWKEMPTSFPQCCVASLGTAVSPGSPWAWDAGVDGGREATVHRALFRISLGAGPAGQTSPTASCSRCTRPLVWSLCTDSAFPTGLPALVLPRDRNPRPRHSHSTRLGTAPRPETGVLSPLRRMVCALLRPGSRQPGCPDVVCPLGPQNLEGWRV